ncbi:altronate dehydratase family protein [Tropicimonas sp. TH_r6]|uniref:UxaA family hydrolase n=1 Tax=Tropicimonas sp. TH_r6 TaxID=3082085 RepID=UPI0029538F0A|nr:altronate dehydratase family protein [Tropicimonas sp. TH_r6]MDV7143075.1 altronate dehydratase family protein [Tropicimonas sp. TH_r6]
MTHHNSPTLRLNDSDNVLVALRAIAAEEAIAPGLTAASEIPMGHKVAATGISEGEAIRKYGQVIGFAGQAIAPGDHIHVQNCTYRGDFERNHEPCAGAKPTDFVVPEERAQFRGYRRPGGGVGTRNYIAVISTVNCSATVARMMAAHFTPEKLADYPNVDGVTAFVHSTGCGQVMGGEGYRMFMRTLAGYATHPNFAGVLMVGLGCEMAQVSLLMETYGLSESAGFHRMVIQESGGTRKTVEDGIARIEAMLPAANAAERELVGAEHLSVALQCGGSDGYSGITANPSLGHAADLVVRHGGTAILAETPEIFGAEHLLTRRAVRPEVAAKLLERIEWWKAYMERNGGSMDNNPSPGNKAGGLTTILEKSLGSSAKGGSTNLVGVYEYAEKVTTPGFVFMDSPGYDPASVTGQVASGANIVCFTTGRGSVFGYKPAPSLKLATNSALYERMSDDMDVDCGEVISKGVSTEEMGQRIFERFLAMASGERSKSEELGFGDNEFLPWLVGAVT